MARENVLWKWLKRGAQKVTELHMERVENSVANGTPDVDGCWIGDCFKIELKRSPARTDGMVQIKFRPLQMPWLRKFWKCGGNGWVLLAVGEGHNVQRFLIKGCDLTDENFPEFRRDPGSVVVQIALSELEEISVIPANATPLQVLSAACMKSFG